MRKVGEGVRLLGLDRDLGWSLLCTSPTPGIRDAAKSYRPPGPRHCAQSRL